MLTSETLEHVPDLDAALAEIHRVLVPGGRHVFTDPAAARRAETFARAVARPDGSLEHRAPRDLPPRRRRRLSRLHRVRGRLPRDPPRRPGFEVEVHFGPTTEDDLAQVYVCRKPE